MQNLNDAKVLGITPGHNSCNDNCGCEEQEIPKFIIKDGRRKLNPTWVKREFAQENYTLLEEFTKATSLVAFKCPVGHEHFISYDAFNRGNRCLYCSNNAPPNANSVRQEFEKEGYVMLGEYTKSKIAVEVVCPKGHTSRIVYNNFKNGSRCRECYRENKDNGAFSQEEVKEFLESINYTLVSNYINSKKHIQVICPNGHKSNTYFQNLKKGHRCLYCSPRKPPDTEFIRQEFEKEGYQLLSNYVNSRTKLDFICPNGHRFSISWGNFRSGKRCLYCANNRPKTTEEVKSELEKEGYILTSEYKNNNVKIEFICPNGHSFKIKFSDFKMGKRCGLCSNKYNYDQEKVERIFSEQGYTVTGTYIGVREKIEVICPKNHTTAISTDNFLKGNRCGFCSNRYNHNQESIEEFFSNQGYKVLSAYAGVGKKMKVMCPKNHITDISTNSFLSGSRCGICYQDQLKGSVNIKALNIYWRVKPLSTIPAKQLKEICNNIYSDELWLFYYRTPPKCAVDHIIPVTWLSMDDPEQIRLCWSLDNLQYLTFSENSRKGNRLTLGDLKALTPAQINILKAATNIPARHQKMVKDFLDSLEDDTWFWSYADTLAAK